MASVAFALLGVLPGSSSGGNTIIDSASSSVEGELK